MSPLPLRKLVKAISFPSGDQAGASLPTTTIACLVVAPADPDRPSSRSAAANSAIRRVLRMAFSVLRNVRGRNLEVSYTCSVLGAIIAIMFAGFVTGALARLAVPGPDPMPIWLTVAIGLAGSWGGGAVAAAIWGWKSTTAVSVFGFVAAFLLVFAYRRFYQGRPVTGPEARRFPERGIGLDRFRQRRAQAEHVLRQQQHARAQAQADDIHEQIRKLADLRDEGALTDDEFETKKRELLARL